MDDAEFQELREEEMQYEAEMEKKWAEQEAMQEEQFQVEMAELS